MALKTFYRVNRNKGMLGTEFETKESAFKVAEEQKKIHPKDDIYITKVNVKDVYYLREEDDKKMYKEKYNYLPIISTQKVTATRIN